MKLTAKQTTALLSATYNPNARGDGMGTYVIHTVHHITRKSLHDKGLMYGHYYLTRKGVEMVALLSGNEVDMYGMEWAGNEGEEYITEIPAVTVQGEYVEPATMTDIDGSVIPHDAFRSQEIQEAHRRIADGGCVGLCAVGTGCEHCDTQYGHLSAETDAESVSYPAPVIADGMDTRFMTTEEKAEALARVERDQEEQNKRSQEMINAPESDWMYHANGLTEESNVEKTISVVAVVQAPSGNAGEQTHYHSAGCRDIEREMRKYGQSEADIFRMDITSAVDILEFEDGGRGSDHAEEYTPEWWNAVVENASYEVRFMSCIRGRIPGGVTTQGAPILINHSIYKVGEIPAPEKSQEDTMRDAGAERFPVGSYVAVKADSVDRVGAYEGEVTSHGTMHYNGWHIPAAYVTSHEGTRKILTGDLEFATDPNEAGFVETDELSETERLYMGASWNAPALNSMATVAKLSTGAGFHTVEESRTATPESVTVTGTTHHTMDTDGNAWTRFEHVLSVGDVVKVVGSQGVYEVHCLIPGLPTVYVLGTQGEPFPVPATDVYAL